MKTACLFLFASTLLLIGCKSTTTKHYRARIIQVMHVSRDISFGGEHNTYALLYERWKEENHNHRFSMNYRRYSDSDKTYLLGLTMTNKKEK